MAGFIISLTYGIEVTLIQMFKSKLFMKELKDLGRLFCNTGGWIYRWLKEIIINWWNILTCYVCKSIEEYSEKKIVLK